MRLAQKSNTQKFGNTLSLLIFLTLLVSEANSQFCSSACIDSVGACYGITSDNCYACATSIYDQTVDNSVIPWKCKILPQTSILWNQLKVDSMSLTGFSSSSLVPFTCSSYDFSGRYTSSDWISRNFTGIGANHYQLVIRFSVGYMGTWSQTDYLQIQITDEITNTYQNWQYSCGAFTQLVNGTTNVTTDNTENLCSSAGTDCIKTKQFKIQHNSSYVFLKISALTSQTDPNIQSWGIKDLLIAAKQCHSYCSTCYGATPNQCLTCGPGLYLRGNTCVTNCPILSVPSMQLCAQTCPMGYFHNTGNNNCEPCLQGCALCAAGNYCIAWQNSDANPDNQWEDKMQLWIILILVGVALIGFLGWKLILSKYFNIQKDESQEKMIKQQQKKSKSSGQMNQITQENVMNQLWVQDIDGVEPVRVDVRRRKKRKADMQGSNNTSQIYF